MRSRWAVWRRTASLPLCYTQALDVLIGAGINKQAPGEVYACLLSRFDCTNVHMSHLSGAEQHMAGTVIMTEFTAKRMFALACNGSQYGRNGWVAFVFFMHDNGVESVADSYGFFCVYHDMMDARHRCCFSSSIFMYNSISVNEMNDEITWKCCVDVKIFCEC